MTETKVREYLIGKALQDDDFRQSLIADPNGTVVAEVGRTLPDRMKLHVHQETQDDLHLVLPAPTELTAGDMAAVAGGSWVNDDNDMDDTHLFDNDPGVDDDTD